MNPTETSTVELTPAQAEELAIIQKRTLWLKRFITAAGTISTGYTVGTMIATVWYQGFKANCK